VVNRGCFRSLRGVRTDDVRQKTRNKPVHIGDIVGGVLKSCRAQGDDELTRVWQLWDGVVGPAIAGNARPHAFKGGLLMVNVSSSPWVQQLRYVEAEILSKLNDALGSRQVTRIRFKVGSL